MDGDCFHSSSLTLFWRTMIDEIQPPAEELSQLAFGVELLAAGASSRMGKPKMLLPWADTSVAGRLLAQWQKLQPRQIAVVCAANDQAIHRELDRLSFPEQNRIINAEPERGMFSSIQCAAKWPGWLPLLTHWIIVLGDQPHLKTGSLRSLLAFARTEPLKICQPSRNGRPRHPVMLPATAFLQLRDSSFSNLKAYLQIKIAETALREMDDLGLDFDLDEPADYERAVRHFSGTD